MSKNIIYCYSGSGNCLSMAKEIAKNLGDTDICLMRKSLAITDASSYDTIGFVVPCYGGGLPAGVEDFVKSIEYSGVSYKYGVVQFAGYMGCGLHKIDKIIGLDYWDRMSNHCSAIWLFPHFFQVPPTTVKGAQKRSDKKAAAIAENVKNRVRSEKKPPLRIINAVESAGFGNINKLINSKMNVSDACVGCTLCAQICPKGNIKIVDGKATIGTNCIGCMACIEYCPQKAINVGKITKKRARYTNKTVNPQELTKAVIHID